jgi:cytochrome c peroxidase
MMTRALSARPLPPRLLPPMMALVVTVWALTSVWSSIVSAQVGRAISSLKGVAVPRPTGLDRYVADERALVALGKALFWDVQLGSDGRTACATCHFHAGADHRLQNQIANPPGSTGALVPNSLLAAQDFPFHAFQDPGNRNSTVLRSRRQVAGSAGVTARAFVDVGAGRAVDVGLDLGDGAPFVMSGLKVRQVTGRNTPSVINAAFNLRNFWDGRASNLFTGFTPFGASDSRSAVMAVGRDGVAPEPVRMDNASLASQAVGPPLNGIEMSYDGRQWPHLGRKMVSLVPLARQVVASDDRVLGPMANPGGLGLQSQYSYDALVRAAFRPAYWDANQVIDIEGRLVNTTLVPRNSREFTLMQYNFALFFGLAIQAYESTLISDDTRVDRFLAGDTAALSPLEAQGLNEFRNNGSQCTRCHQGPELTAAGYTTARAGNIADPRDVGFFRTGVSLIEEDFGAAAVDGFGLPLFPGAVNRRADGAFKSPGLRNVELTGPYFHTGGAATLEQVMEFYDRDGDLVAGGNLGTGIGNINLNAQDRTELVALMLALTDDRVKFERAPFDHPALCVPVGHVEASPGVLRPDTSADGHRADAADAWALVPAVGQRGHAVPLQTFHEQLLGVGLDGTRAHTLDRTCAP